MCIWPLNWSLGNADSAGLCMSGRCDSTTTAGIMMLARMYGVPQGRRGCVIRRGLYGYYKRDSGET